MLDPAEEDDEVQMVARAPATGDRARPIILDRDNEEEDEQEEDDGEEEKKPTPHHRSTRLQGPRG